MKKGNTPMSNTHPIANQVMNRFEESFQNSFDVKDSLATMFDNIRPRCDENEVEFIEGTATMEGNDVSARVYQNAKYPLNPRIIVKVSNGTMTVKDWRLI